jgi:hypothetical protein
MSYATLQTSEQTFDVICFRMSRPSLGPWRMTGELDVGEDSISGEGAVNLIVGDRLLVGWLTRAESLGGRARVEVVGGHGGWGLVVGARDYLEVLPKTIVAHLIADAGETLADGVVDDLPLTVIGTWARAEGAAGVSLTILCRRLGLVWRVLDNGDTWIGAEEWPSAPRVTLPPEEAYGDDSSLLIVPDEPTIEPGMVWTDSRRIDRVVYVLDEGSQLHAELHFETAVGGDVDRALFERAIRAALRELAFLPRYPSEVVAQREDGRLELRPDDTRQAGTPPLAPLYGLPGVRCEVPAGARVGLVYNDANPAGGRAEGWEQSTPSTLTEIDANTIKLGASATRGVVRLNDLGHGGTFTAAGPTLTYASQDGLTVWSITGIADPGTGVVTWTTVPVLGDRGLIVTKATEASSEVLSK